MKPVDIYEYYVERVVEILKLKEIRMQMEDIKRMGVTIAVFDFCGKIPLVHKLFVGVKKEVFVVYDVSKCREEIYEAFKGHDLIYVLEDIQSAESNIFYKYNNAIFLLFDRFRFIRCMKEG
ncbi:uncharacterized protein Eint_050200 [Encephalitozoon intestinalis ATCC 50506]|uniref:Uncharacterized protein n=1 Tax=Encephalitozoon intestinalis (strain ATCC 50506) TaxID=876142 RepID=E0S741_ENCIT|nr:uncharacterized protein Eint_050200 [Encephalitozoon intestinalis ATCC 50506]ADM11469.1 hypothetical protein Eint_050200 [Encephalitozoon intestinalis ATCC 50506]UTX45181.1 putative tetrapyrrole methylase [Encephalitozoon intestinalis]